MRRFTVYAPNCTEDDRNAWEDVSFQLVEMETGWDPEKRPDVVFWRWSGDFEAKQKQVESILPKLYVIVSSNELPAPDTLSAIYERQVIRGEGIYFTIGSKLEGKVSAPDWEACRSGGQPAETEQIKAVAGAVYRYLLEDVFRETAEWCGHMSSVVGPA